MTASTRSVRRREGQKRRGIAVAGQCVVVPQTYPAFRTLVFMGARNFPSRRTTVLPTARRPDRRPSFGCRSRRHSHLARRSGRSRRAFRGFHFRADLAVFARGNLAGISALPALAEALWRGEPRPPSRAATARVACARAHAHAFARARPFRSLNLCVMARKRRAAPTPAAADGRDSGAFAGAHGVDGSGRKASGVAAGELHERIECMLRDYDVSGKGLMRSGRCLPTATAHTTEPAGPAAVPPAVQSRCERMRIEMRRLVLLMRNEFAIELIRLPKAVRQARLCDLLERPAARQDAGGAAGKDRDVGGGAAPPAPPATSTRCQHAGAKRDATHGNAAAGVCSTLKRFRAAKADGARTDASDSKVDALMCGGGVACNKENADADSARYSDRAAETDQHGCAGATAPGTAMRPLGSRTTGRTPAQPRRADGRMPQTPHTVLRAPRRGENLLSANGSPLALPDEIRCARCSRCAQAPGPLAVPMAPRSQAARLARHAAGRVRAPATVRP